MNNDKRTTRERAIEWWEGLTHSLERDNLNKKYFPFSSLASITYPNIEHIYLSEHPEPIKPVVDVLEGKNNLVMWVEGNCPPIDLNQHANHVVRLVGENKLLRESNERMKEALKKNHQWALCLLSDIEAGNVEYEEKYCLELNQDISEATELLK